MARNVRGGGGPFGVWFPIGAKALFFLNPAGERLRACSPGARPQPGGKRRTAPIGRERRHAWLGLHGLGEGVRGRGISFSGMSSLLVSSLVFLASFALASLTVVFLVCSFSPVAFVCGLFCFGLVPESVPDAFCPKTPRGPPAHRGRGHGVIVSGRRSDVRHGDRL